MRLNKKGKAMMHYGAYQVLENGEDPFVMGAVMGICAGLFGTSNKKNKKSCGKNKSGAYR